MSTKPITAKPHQGGRLMTDISSENVTIYNYDVKRDFRRYNDREIRSEGRVLFCPKMFTDDEDAKYIPTLPTSDPVTLVVMLTHPNGSKSIIAGTATTLWRYYGMEDPLYFDAGYFDADYFDEELTAWRQIGSGFASNARRWECETLDGYLILNNGVDLPVQYRLTYNEVIPLYELRELAIASVGTIVVQNGHLLCMDIRQIKEDKFLEIMTPISIGGVSQSGVDSAGVGAKINSGADGVAGNTITAESNNFNGGAGFTGMEGRTIRMLNGEVVIIDTVVSDTEATILGDAILAEPFMNFFLPIDETDFSIGANVTLESLSFPKTGLQLWWESGDSRIITGQLGENWLVNLDSPIASGLCVLENPLAYARFTDESYIDRYQNRVIQSLPGAPTRFGSIIPATISPQDDIVRLDYPIKSIPISAGQITMTGMAAGNLTADGIYFDGMRILVANLAITSFYSAAAAAVADAEQAVEDAKIAVDGAASTLLASEDALNKANEALAADPDDADLSTAAADASSAVDAARAAKTAADAALTSAEEKLVEAQEKSAEEEDIEFQMSDSLSDVSRIEDLQHDGAEILKAVSMDSVLLIFTSTSIFIARYSPSVGAFSYTLRVIPKEFALFYRNTPVFVDSSFVLYAAESQFCKFDFTTQRPTAIGLIGDCQNIFYDQADPEDDESIFSCINGVTKEVFIRFPSDTDDKVLRLDYDKKTVSTSSMDITSGATVVFPGTNRNVFVTGSFGGALYRYGLVMGGRKLMTGTASKSGSIVTTVAETFSEIHIGQTILFSNGSRFGILKINSPTEVEVVGSGDVASSAFYIEPACWHNNGSAYTSVLQSGGFAFGNESSYKKIARWTATLSGFSPNNPITAVIRSGRNINEVSDKISKQVTPPSVLVAPILSDFFLCDRIEVAGINNPLEITGRTFHISQSKGDSFGRRNSDG